MGYFAGASPYYTVVPFTTGRMIVEALVYALVIVLDTSGVMNREWSIAYRTLWVHVGVATLATETGIVNTRLAVDIQTTAVRLRDMELVTYRTLAILSGAVSLLLASYSLRDLLHTPDAGMYQERMALSGIVLLAAVWRLIDIARAEISDSFITGSPQTKDGFYMVAPASVPQRTQQPQATGGRVEPLTMAMFPDMMPHTTDMAPKIGGHLVHMGIVPAVIPMVGGHNTVKRRGRKRTSLPACVACRLENLTGNKFTYDMVPASYRSSPASTFCPAHCAT